jgi:molecular chaperone DnaK
MKDNDDKLPEDVKSSVQADVDALKSALAGDDVDAVKTAFDTLVQSQQKLGEEIYKQQPEGEAAPESSAEDVVDAEVIDDEEKK